MSRDTFRIAVRKFAPFESTIRKQWEAFESVERTGLALEAEPLDLHPLYEAVFERGGWDVAFLNTDWVAAADEAGCAADLAPLVAADPPEGYPGAWTQSLLRLQQTGGRLLGMPYHDGPECLIYRTDLVAAPPETWADFRRLARELSRPGRALYGTTFAAYPDGHNTVYDFCIQVWSRGGELFDSRGRLRLDSPQAIAGLEFYRDMLNDAGSVHPRSREFDSVKSGLAFAAGEIAMMVNWFGFAAMCETVADSQVKGRVGVAGVPRGEGGAPVSLNVYWILSAAARSPHRDTAYRFIRHCASKEMDKLLTLEGGIGCRRSTWADAEVNRAVPFYSRLESLHAGARELPRLSQWPRIASLIDELVLGAINTAEPAAALAQAAQARAAEVPAR